MELKCFGGDFAGTRALFQKSLDSRTCMFNCLVTERFYSDDSVDVALNGSDVFLAGVCSAV